MSSACLLTLGLVIGPGAPAAAGDDQLQAGAASDQLHPSEPAELRTAQLWPFGPRPSSQARDPGGNARYYYVQPRDFFGNPGPVYRVLGVEKRKPKKPSADRHKLRVAEQLRKAPPAPPTAGPLLLAISLAKQQVTLYDQGVAVASSPISSGTASHPTPTGIFSVIQKQWWHRSNLYSAAPMPFMQRLTWSGVALHAGELPGYPASHGCIRLPDDFAIRLWGTTKIGTRVVVTQGEIKPVEIAHPRLFAPKPKPKGDPTDAPMASYQPSGPARLVEQGAQEGGVLEPLARQGQLSVASLPITAAVLDRAAASDGMEFLANVPSTLTLVNPDGSAVADGDEVAADGDDDDDVAVTNTAAPVQAGDPIARKVNKITIVRPGQPDEVLEVTEAPDIAETGRAKITVMRGGRPAEIEVIAVTKVAPEPQVALTLPEPETPLVVAHNGVVTAAVRARRIHQAQPLDAPVIPPSPLVRPLRPGPISVFVSRKERRLFVRKGFEPLFDMPVTIADPERALGNHVFTAVAVGETDARWTAISLPVERLTTVRRYVETGRGKYKRRVRRLVTEFVSAPPPTSAGEVLDRIEIPSDARTRISELMSVGATLIVSDDGLGRETGRETDFTVLTK